MQKLHQKHLLYRLGPISSLTNPYLLTLTLSCCKASAASVTRVQLFSSSKINKKDWESRNGRRKRERQRPGPAKFSKFAVREFARTRENHRDRQVGREPLISMASRIVKREGGESKNLSGSRAAAASSCASESVFCSSVSRWWNKK